MKNFGRGLWLAFLFVVGCAHVAPPLPPAPAPRGPPIAAILGEPGETVSHLHARIIVRACTGDDGSSELADRVERFVLACVASDTAAPQCEEKACTALRRDPATCPAPWASR